MTLTGYACTECGYRSIKPLGRCPVCGTWGSLKPLADEAEPELIELGTLPLQGEPRFSSGFAEVDRVLGGGFVPGEVILLGGEPGVGKSTLLLQVAQRLRPRSIVYVVGEESPGQIRLRAERLGITEGLHLLRATEIEEVLRILERAHPEVLFVDSIQSLTAGGAPGSLVSLRTAGARLTQLAKTLNLTTVLVGHVTKEGIVAGPKVLEHTVDATLYLEAAGSFRLLRATKNRFGPVGELGVLRMDERGLEEVPNPSAAFLVERPRGVPGSAVALALSGERALALEIQALAARTPFPAPRRVTQGLEGRRVDVILAVLERRLHLPLANLDRKKKGKREGR
jgi:DNA repair protein RadA/Sms